MTTQFDKLNNEFGIMDLMEYKTEWRVSGLLVNKEAGVGHCYNNLFISWNYMPLPAESIRKYMVLYIEAQENGILVADSFGIHYDRMDEETLNLFALKNSRMYYRSI